MEQRFTLIEEPTELTRHAVCSSCGQEPTTKVLSFWIVNGRNRSRRSGQCVGDACFQQLRVMFLEKERIVLAALMEKYQAQIIATNNYALGHVGEEDFHGQMLQHVRENSATLDQLFQVIRGMNRV